MLNVDGLSIMIMVKRLCICHIHVILNFVCMLQVSAAYTMILWIVDSTVGHGCRLMGHSIMRCLHGEGLPSSGSCGQHD